LTLDLYLPRVVAVALDRYAYRFRVERLSSKLFRPFNDDDCLVVEGENVIHPDRDRRIVSLIEPPQIDMICIEPSVIEIDQRKARTRNFFRIEIEAGQQTFCQNCFSRAQSAGKQYQLAASQSTADLFADAKRLVV